MGLIHHHSSSTLPQTAPSDGCFAGTRTGAPPAPVPTPSPTPAPPPPPVPRDGRPNIVFLVVESTDGCAHTSCTSRHFHSTRLPLHVALRLLPPFALALPLPLPFSLPHLLPLLSFLLLLPLYLYPTCTYPRVLPALITFHLPPTPFTVYFQLPPRPLTCSLMSRPLPCSSQPHVEQRLPKLCTRAAQYSQAAGQGRVL